VSSIRVAFYEYLVDALPAIENADNLGDVSRDPDSNDVRLGCE
jgi:hypothetical protein